MIKVLGHDNHSWAQHRILAGRFPRSENRGDVGSRLHMFIQDICLGMMPMKNLGSEEDDFQFSILGSDDAVERAVCLLQSLSRRGSGNWRDEQELISDAAEEVARRLAWEGRGSYEIVWEEKLPFLAYVPNEHLICLFGHVLQFVPKADRETYGKAVLKAPEHAIWRVSMPGSLGGPSGHARLFKRLRRVGSGFPEFYSDDLKRGQRSTDFSFSEYRSYVDNYILSETRNWGWQIREYGTKYFTEIVVLIRYLRFRKAQIILRDHIINELSCLMKRLDLGTSLSVSGLVSVGEIDDGIRKLRDGEITFDEAYALGRK